MDDLIFILNGPNLNLLGKHQPLIYGHETLSDVERECREFAKELKLEVDFRQSNREFEVIDWVHEAREKASGLVINPAAFAHTSVAILDALNTFERPVVEVHIPQIHKSGAFRHYSYVSERADAVVSGFGIQGYGLALRWIVNFIADESRPSRVIPLARHR